MLLFLSFVRFLIRNTKCVSGSSKVLLLCLQSLSDAYGLLMHTNGQWEWTLAPGVSPSPRYQHAAVSGLIRCITMLSYTM